MTAMPFRRPLAALALLAFATGAGAQSFSAQVSPPRFEATVKPGETYRDVLEIQNISVNAARFEMRTADWTLAPDGTVAFEYALQPGSCRPWVGIEAPELQMPANGRRRYRFEVAVPVDAPSGQCRFAVMIEGEPQKTATGVSVAGRLGIIVYVNIGDAAAKLQVIGSEARVDGEGRRVPFLQIRNDGNAHGRLEGFVDAVDGSGKRWTLSPSSDPILPGATRAIPLHPETSTGEPVPPPFTWPLKIDGELQWGSQQIPVSATVPQ